MLIAKLGECQQTQEPSLTAHKPTALCSCFLLGSKNLLAGNEEKTARGGRPRATCAQIPSSRDASRDPGEANRPVDIAVWTWEYKHPKTNLLDASLGSETWCI